ncbi:MAG: trypsin-like peptidase domain-containing protein [Planctomycetota bacterium]
MMRLSWILCFVFSVSFPSGVFAEEPLPSRETPAVRVIRDVQPAAAAIYARRKDGRTGWGSGSVIDPRGYVLTAQHIVGDQHLVVLAGRSPLRAKLIGTTKDSDLAILQLGGPAFNRPASPKYPLDGTTPAFIRLATADSVLLGETILNVGAPGGRGVVVTQGIVSAVNFIGTNPLSLATQSSLGFDQSLQFDAASNPGNSGGALINMHGRQIGVVTSSVRSEEGIHFAVPPDTIRDSIPKLLYAEYRHRYRTGITVDTQREQIFIDAVEASSPAMEADLRAGDQIVSLDGRALRDPIDWEFSKLEFRAGDRLRLGILRQGKELAVELPLVERQPTPGIEVEEPVAGLLARVSEYDPRNPDPLADDDRPAGPPSVIESVTATPPDLPREEHYEVLITGLLKVEQSGLYRLGIASDDGSKLFLHDRLLIDNGGNHSAQRRTDWAFLAEGLHPIRIEYYEDEGNQELELSIAAGDEKMLPVAPDQLFHIADGK